MNNKKLEKHLNECLQIDQYRDYAPNGLQVEGKAEINKVICGVTASMALIDVAIERGADAIIAHHGYFWKGEAPTITDIKQRRIKALLTHDINLYGYHLPLDGHETLGNNAQLGRLWQVTNAAPVAPFELMWTGSLTDDSTETTGISTVDFAETLTQTLGRKPLTISGGTHTIRKLAWCSGGAQGFLAQAVALGADAYVSGEVSEKTFHEAKEYGIHYFAAGHHATERGGVMAIADALNATTDLSCEFIDCWNPV